MHKNYSDMTGLNVRVVNPDLTPLKGYWSVINDSGITNLTWNLVSWNASTSNLEVFVRASSNRQALASERFVSVTNNIPLTNVLGQCLEVRAALIRPDPSQHLELYDLTLYGTKP